MKYLAGKTIAAVEERKYGTLELVFTDGTSALFEPQGYEAEDIGVSFLSVAERRSAQRRRQGEREVALLERLKREETRAAYKAARESMTDSEFRAWRLKREGPLGYFMREEYAGLIEDQMRSTSRMLLGGFGVAEPESPAWEDTRNVRVVGGEIRLENDESSGD